MGLENVRKVAEADFPTRWGAFRILGFEGTRSEGQPGCAPARTVEGLVALVMGDVHTTPPLVRIHKSRASPAARHVRQRVWWRW